MVWELRLSRMVEILFTKKSQNLCGRSTDGTEDGRDEVFDLPRRVFVMLNCLDEVHARILVLIYVTLESFQEHFVRTIIYYYYIYIHTIILNSRTDYRKLCYFPKTAADCKFATTFFRKCHLTLSNPGVLPVPPAFSKSLAPPPPPPPPPSPHNHHPDNCKVTVTEPSTC